MPQFRVVALQISILLVAGLSPCLAARAQQAAVSGPQVASTALPPSDSELKARREELIANQHADDDALNLYERIERHVEHAGETNPRILSDRTYRVVPTGGGTMKILLRNHDAGVSTNEYLHQLQQWEDVLEMMSTPGDSKGAAARAKFEKRERQRTEFVDAAQDAFVPKWLGRQTRDGRDCDVFELDPNPEFHPTSIFQSALAHVTAKIWVDHRANQIVRGEAWVTSDISFVAGIAGKVYRGSRVAMEQGQVAPGIWLPTYYEYDFAGRKFLFPFAQHQTIDISHYRRVGPPSEALAEVRTEIASGKGPIADP